MCVLFCAYALQLKEFVIIALLSLNAIFANHGSSMRMFLTESSAVWMLAVVVGTLVVRADHSTAAPQYEGQLAEPRKT